MKASKKKTDFLAMWSSEGLEGVFDLSRWKKEHKVWEKEKIWSVIKGVDHTTIEPTVPLKVMLLRARFNSHRQCEIYTFTAESGITKEDVEELFQTNPQYIVDFIRKNGYKIYSDYKKEDKKIIK